MKKLIIISVVVLFTVSCSNSVSIAPRKAESEVREYLLSNQSMPGEYAKADDGGILFYIPRGMHDDSNRIVLDIPAEYSGAQCYLQIGCRFEWFRSDRFEGVSVSFQGDTTAVINDEHAIINNYMIKFVAE